MEAIREVEACFATVTQDAEAMCAAAIREAEAACVDCAHALQ